ncbi:ABC transporter permease [Nakamurella lactea]|uniref:ABC transporter permease n=1 Tax=Nakamurella lactea TaxID=459515 RepID=UPI0003F8248E|nr:ABC transporter permease [Nakamurella lactea]
MSVHDLERDKRAARLATEPLVPAGPTTGFLAGTGASIRGVWQYRELLRLLVRRELKARYKDSVLGFLWTLIKPLAMLLVYYFAIGKFLGAERSIPEFAIYIFAGLTAWTLFSEIVSTGTGSIVGNGGLVKKIYLPREVFPLSVIGSALVNFFIQLAILYVATLLTGSPPGLDRLVFVVAGIAIILIWATAWAFLLSAVNVYLRDVQWLVEIALMVGFWASPIVYSWEQVSGQIGGTIWGDLYLANPVTIAVMYFQRGLWVAGSDKPQPTGLGVHAAAALVVGLILLWVFQRVFARLQANFAQEL